MRRVLRAAANPAYLALFLLLVVGFVLRVKNNDYGLPYVYNVDEGSHFTARAVGMLGGDWNPHYFQNPSAFTYLANFALRLRFGKAAIDRHLEYFRFTGMDFVKVQYERTFPPLPQKGCGYLLALELLKVKYWQYIQILLINWVLMILPGLGSHHL